MNPARLSIAATLLTLSVSVLADETAKPAASAASGQGVSGPVLAVTAFAAALAKGDEAAALKVLAPDVLIYESGGQEASRTEYAAHHLKDDIAFLAGARIDVIQRSTGGDDHNAWVSTRSKITAHGKDKDLELLSTETMMLKHESDGWRIVHIHWSSRSAAKSS